MPVPIILGALAAIAGGLGVGTLKRKVIEDQQERALMIDTVTQIAQSGQPVPPQFAQKAGIKPELLQALTFAGQAKREAQQSALAGFQKMLQGESAPAAGGGTGVELTPPAPSVDPSGQPAAGGSLPAMPMLTAQAIRPKPSVSGTFDYPGGGKVTIGRPGVSELEARRETEHRAGQAFIADAAKSTKSHPDLIREAASKGLLTDPNVQKSIDTLGQTRYNEALGEITKGRPFTSQLDFVDAQMQAYGQTGYMPADLLKSLAPTPQLQDEMFARTFARWRAASPDVPFSALFNAVQGATNITPSAALKQSITQQAGAAIEQELRGTRPDLVNNPAAIEAEKQKRLGYVGTSEAERARMDAPVNDPDLQAERARMGLPPLRESQLRGLEAQAPGLPDQKKMAEHRKVAKESEAAHARAFAAARGAIEAKPLATLTPQEREHFVDPKTLTVPPQGTKWGDVEGGGKYVSFTGTKADLAGATRLRQIVKTYKESIEDLRPLLRDGSLATRARSLGIVGTSGIKIPFTNISVGSIPAGALPDDKALATAFPNMPKEQAIKYAKAMVRIQAAEDTGLSILRTFFNEKGNVRGDLIQSGIRSLPTLGDNELTATTKFENLLAFTDAWERGFGLPGRAGAEKK